MSLRLDFVDKWTVDQYRDALDTDEQWDLKRSFMLAHCESFPVERLLYFTEIFCNITFKMCPYPVSIMTRIEEMSKDVFTSKHAVLQNRFYKTLVEVLRSEPQSHIKRATGYNETRQQSEKTHDDCTSSFTNRNQDFLYDQESDSRNIAELNIQSSKTSSIKRGGVLQNSSPIREDRGCSILDRAFHTIYGDYTFHEDESECVDDFSMTPNFQSISSKSLISLHISKNHEEKILEYHSEMFREAVVKDNSSIGKRDNDLPLENHCQLQNPLVTDNMIERIKSISEEHCQSKNPLTTSKTSVLPAYDNGKSTSLNNTNLESINIRLEEDNGINPDHFDCESRVDTGISDDEADEPLVTKLISYPILSSLSFDLSSKIRSMKRDRNSRSDQKVHESRKNNHKEERSDRACKKDGRSDSRELGRYSPERGHHSRKYKSPERRQHTRKYKSPERGLHSRKDKSLVRYSDRNKFRKLDNDDRSMKRRRDDSTHRRSPVSRHNSRNSNISYDDERRRRKDRDSPTSGEYDEQRSLNDRRLEPRSLFRRHSYSDSDNDGRDCRSRRRLEKDSEFHRDRDRRLKDITDTDRLSYEQRSGSVGMDYQPQANFHQPQPDYHQPQPNSYQPPVNFHQPLGNFHQPEAMYPQPQSMYPQSQSMYPQPQPMYPQPQSMYPQPQPMYPQPQSMYHQPEAIHHQSQPMYPQSQANFHQPQSNLYQPQSNFHNSHLSGGMTNWGQTMPSQATLMGKGQNSKLPPGKSAITSSHAKAVPIKVQNADVNILKQVSTTQNPGLNEVAKLNEIKTIAALNTILTCGGIPLNFNPSILPNVSLNLPFQNRTKIPSKPVCYKHTPTVTQTSKKNKVKPPTSQNQKTSGNVSSSAAKSKPVVSPAPSRNMKNPSPSQNKNKTTIKTVSPNTPTLSISSNKRKLTDDFGEISNWLITVDDDEGDYGISSEKKLKLDKQDSDKWKIGLAKESVKFYVEANMRPYLKSVLEITLQDVRQRAGPLGSVAIICLKNEQAKKTLLRLNHLLENFKLKIVHETHACGENTTWTCRIDACCTNSNKVSQICVAEAPNKHEAEKAVCDRVLWYLQHIYFTFFFVKLEPNRPNEVKTCDIVLRRLCEYGFTQKLPPNFLDDTNYCTEVPFTTADDKKTYFTALKDFAKSVTMSSEGYKFIHFSPKISIGTNESLMNVANSLSLFSRWKGDKDSGLLVFRLTRKMYWDFVKVMFDRPFVCQKMPSNFVFNFHIMRPHQTSAKYGPINLMTQNTDDETKKNDKETIEETKKTNEETEKTIEETKKTNEETEKTIEETKKTNKETEKTNFETKTVDVRTCEPVVAPAANTNMKKPSPSQNKTTIETVSPKTPTLSISSNKRKLADAFGETSNWVITVDDDEGDYGISSEKKPKLDKQDSDKWKIGLSKESVKFYVKVNMRPYLKSVHEITLQDVRQRAGPLGSIAIMCLKDEQAKKTLLRLNYLLQNLKLKIMYESHKCRGNTQWTCRIDACCTNSNKVTQICVAEAPTKHEAETAVCTRVLWYLQHIYFSFFFVKLEPNITHDSKTGDFVLRRFCEYGFRQKLPPNFLDNPNYCKEVPFTTAGDKYSYFAALKDFAKSVTMSSEGYKFIHFSPKLSEATNERLKSLAACLSLFSRWKSDKDSGIVMFRLTRKMYWDFVKVMLDRPSAHHKIHGGNFVFEFHVMKPHQTIAKYRPINLITRKTNDETKKNNKETKKTNDETKKTNDETNKKNEESNDESVKNNEETKKPIEKTKKTNYETYKNNEGSNDESVKNNEETKKPIEKTKKTNDKTKKTNDETKKTNDETKKTKDETKKTNETKKMNDETKKMNDETQKMNDETKKTNDETQKMDDETKKTNDETKETNDETRKNNLETNDEIEKNDEETKKPIEETKKPIEETKKPIEETKKNNEPTNDEIGKNNEETKKPIEETKKTNDETKKNNEETIDEIEENNEENKKLIEETKKTNDETKKNYESEKNNEETKKPFEESKKTNDKTKKKNDETEKTNEETKKTDDETETNS